MNLNYIIENIDFNYFKFYLKNHVFNTCFVKIEKTK